MLFWQAYGVPQKAKTVSESASCTWEVILRTLTTGGVYRNDTTPLPGVSGGPMVLLVGYAANRFEMSENYHNRARQGAFVSAAFEHSLSGDVSWHRPLVSRLTESKSKCSSRGSSTYKTTKVGC